MEDIPQDAQLSRLLTGSAFDCSFSMNWFILVWNQFSEPKMPTLFWPFPSRERYHRARSDETSTEELLSPITGFPPLQEIKADDHEYLYKRNSRILLRWKVIAIASSSLSLVLLGLLPFLFHLLAQRYFRHGTPGIYCKSRPDPILIDFRSWPLT